MLRKTSHQRRGNSKRFMYLSRFVIKRISDNMKWRFFYIKPKIRSITLEPIWLPHWPPCMWTISRIAARRLGHEYKRNTERRTMTLTTTEWLSESHWVSSLAVAVFICLVNPPTQLVADWTTSTLNWKSNSRYLATATNSATAMAITSLLVTRVVTVRFS